jgi:hypothetical protein
MAFILKANKVNLFVSSVLFVFWYYLPNFLDTPRMSKHVIFRVDKSVVVIASDILVLFYTRHCMTPLNKQIWYRII